MARELWYYLWRLLNGVPLVVYEGLLLIFIIGTVFVVALKGRHFGRYVAFLLIIEYIILIFCSTVVFRYATAFDKCKFTLFWSYDKPELIKENIMNVLVFVPIGFLMGCAIKEIKWWQVLIIGVSVSFSIELLQLVLKRGYSELDDMMHNVIGCMIGYGMLSFVKYGYDRIYKGRVGKVSQND